MIPITMANTIISYAVLVWFCLRYKYNILLLISVPLLLLILVDDLNNLSSLEGTLIFSPFVLNIIDDSILGISILYALAIVFSKSRERKFFRLYGLFSFIISITILWAYITVIEGQAYLFYLESIPFVALAYAYYKELGIDPDVRSEVIDDEHNE